MWFENFNWVLIKTELQEAFEDNLAKENECDMIFFILLVHNGIVVSS